MPLFSPETVNKQHIIDLVPEGVFRQYLMAQAPEEENKLYLASIAMLYLSVYFSGLKTVVY